MGHGSWFIDPRVRFIGHVSGSYHTNVDTGNWRMYTGHAYFYTTHTPESRSLASMPSLSMHAAWHIHGCFSDVPRARILLVRACRTSVRTSPHRLHDSRRLVVSTFLSKPRPCNACTPNSWPHAPCKYSSFASKQGTNAQRGGGRWLDIQSRKQCSETPTDPKHDMHFQTLRICAKTSLASTVAHGCSVAEAHVRVLGWTQHVEAAQEWHG